MALPFSYPVPPEGILQHAALIDFQGTKIQKDSQEQGRQWKGVLGKIKPRLCDLKRYRNVSTAASSSAAGTGCLSPQ